MDYGPLFRANMARGGGIGVQGPMAIADYQARIQRNDPARQLQILQIMQTIKDSQAAAQLNQLKMQDYIRGRQDADASARAFASMLVPGAMDGAPQPPAPGQASVPMASPAPIGAAPAGFLGASPAAQQGMARQAYSGIMAQPQQQPIVAPVPRSAAQGFMSDPKVLNMITYARNARLSPGAIQKAIMDYFPIWQAEQSARTKSDSFDALNAYRLGSLERRDRALDMRESTLEGSWGGAPEDIESNPLGLGRDEWLNTLPTGLASDIQSLAGYEQKPPTASEMKTNPGLQKTMRAVKSYFPDYKGISGYNVMQEFKNPTKKTGQAMNAFDTAIQHLDVVEEAARELENGTFKPTNAVAQRIASLTGDPAPDSFDGVKQFVINEVLRAASGNALALADRQELDGVLNKAQSPAQMSAVLSRFRQLMAGRLLSYQNQYVEGTGLSNFDQLLSPRSREVFGGVLGGKGIGSVGGGASPAAPSGGIEFLGFE